MIPYAFNLHICEYNWEQIEQKSSYYEFEQARIFIIEKQGFWALKSCFNVAVHRSGVESKRDPIYIVFLRLLYRRVVAGACDREVLLSTIARLGVVGKGSNIGFGFVPVDRGGFAPDVSGEVEVEVVNGLGGARIVLDPVVEEIEEGEDEELELEELELEELELELEEDEADTDPEDTDVEELEGGEEIVEIGIGEVDRVEGGGGGRYWLSASKSIRA